MYAREGSDSTCKHKPQCVLVQITLRACTDHVACLHRSRCVLAQSAKSPMRDNASDAISEDSMAVALEDAECLVKAITVY